MTAFDEAWSVLKMPQMRLSPEDMQQYWQPMRLGPLDDVLSADPAQSTIPEGQSNMVRPSGRGGSHGVPWSPQLEVPTSSALSPETLARMRWEGWGGPKSAHTQGFKINTRTSADALEGQPEGTSHLYTFRPRMETAGDRAPRGHHKQDEKENWDMNWYEGNKYAGVNKWGRPVNQGWWDQKVLHQNPTRDQISRVLQEGTSLTDHQDRELFRNLRHRTPEGRAMTQSLRDAAAENSLVDTIARREGRKLDTSMRADERKRNPLSPQDSVEYEAAKEMKRYEDALATRNRIIQSNKRDPVTRRLPWQSAIHEEHKDKPLKHRNWLVAQEGKLRSDLFTQAMETINAGRGSGLADERRNVNTSKKVKVTPSKKRKLGTVRGGRKR